MESDGAGNISDVVDRCHRKSATEISISLSIISLALKSSAFPWLQQGTIPDSGVGYCHPDRSERRELGSCAVQLL